MPKPFPEIMAALRKEKGISQRTAASDLHISQALLSHYENGAREPGLEFICRACDYYGVSADYLLGRTEDTTGHRSTAEIRDMIRQLRAILAYAENLVEDRH